MAQLDWRICGRLHIGKFGCLLQRLPGWLGRVVVIVEDRDLASFKTQRTETYATIIGIVIAVSLAQLVSCAEVDNRCHAVEFNTANEAAITCQGIAQITATVFPVVIDKRHSFFPVAKADGTGQWIQGVQSENSTSSPRRLFLIRQRGHLCAQQLRGAET